MLYQLNYIAPICPSSWLLTTDSEQNQHEVTLELDHHNVPSVSSMQRSKTKAIGKVGNERPKGTWRGENSVVWEKIETRLGAGESTKIQEGCLDDSVG